MNKINIEKIDKYLVKPIYIQVALDVKWDKAWKIPFTEREPNNNEIKDFLAQGGSKLAFELFYKTNYHGKILCGSYFSQNVEVPTMESFLSNIFDVVFNYDISKVSLAIEHMNNKLGNKDKLFKNNCAEVELGILDFWRFYPACTLLETADSNININLPEKLKEFPYLQTNKDNTALLELVCDYNPLHFVGFTVSDKTEDEYLLNIARITEIVQVLLGNS